MHPYAEEIHPRVFPLRTVLLLLVTSIGASYWLVPRQDQLVERLFLDKQYDRMAEYLRTGLSDSASYKASDIRHLSADQLTLLSHLMRLTPREQLNVIFSRERTPQYNRIIHGVAMAAMRYIDVIPPDEAWRLVQPHLARIDGRQQLEICQLLATNSLALRKPAQAAEILAHAARLPEAGWPACRNMVLSFRWSGQTAAGVKELDAWIKAHQKGASADDFKQANTLGREMALESGDPSLAFDFCVNELSALPQTATIPAEMMKAAYDLAMQSSRTRDLVPWLSRYVAVLPESRVDWKTLHEQAAKTPDVIADFMNWAGLLAKFYDWNSDFEHAFDTHYRLAAAGSLESLDRCLQLSDFLGCDEETAQLLETVKPFKEREGTVLVLARLLASLGRDEDSQKLYEAWISAHPDDRTANYEFACLLEDMGDEEASMNALADLVRRFPGDVQGVKKLAEARIRASRYPEALALYASLQAGDHDSQTLENYAMLAESLDDHVQLHHALQLTVKSQEKPSVETYLDLAEAASYLDDPTIQTDGLQDAIARIPGSARLHLALANAWIRSEDYEQAVTTLVQQATLRDNLEAVSLALSLAADVRDPTRILDFVGSDVEHRFALSVSSRLDLAVLYRACGDAAKSDKIFAIVPESPENMSMIAEAHFQIGDYEDAARLMSAHMASHPRAGANEWIFLGDIYEALGKADDARRAYDYSLALLTADLPDTAFLPESRPPAPAGKP